MLSWLRSIRQTLPRLQLPDTGSLDEKDVTAEYVTMSFLIFEKIHRINLLDNKVAKINANHRSVLTFPSCLGEGVTLVLGYMACDLDSGVSSIVMAYHR